jgi:predicted nucleic acid-binding protein
MGADLLVLIDTSAWIDVFRGRTPALAVQVRALIEEERAALCDVVLAEIRIGLREEERAKVMSLLEAIPVLPLAREDWASAGDLGAALRTRGRTVPLTDLLIAALCRRTGAAVLTLDGHFCGIEGLRLVERS